jgi:prefoldin subunit 5
MLTTQPCVNMESAPAAGKRKPMTIDERIQALTMNLELLSQLHADFQKSWTAIASDMSEAIKRLTNIAESHSASLEDHESRIEDLEK